MTTTFRCDDKDTLVAFLYDEIDPQLGREVSAHLRTCAACASEVEALQSVRRDLAAWQPPEAELNFAIVQKPATILRPSRWSARSIPAWMQAAAAVLVLAAGAALANLQVRYGSEGLTVSTGWMHAPPAPVATPPAAAAGDWRPVLTALEADLRRELQMMRSTRPEPAPREATASVDQDALLRRVQALVNESERRQQQELAVRMAQLGRDVQSDLFRINQGFRQLQGQTRAVEGNQREIVNFVRRVSTQQIP
jgi:anti-sigma factor RsiW